MKTPGAGTSPAIATLTFIIVPAFTLCVDTWVARIVVLGPAITGSFFFASSGFVVFRSALSPPI
ncbi:MAG: hypothetical protein A2666_03810 [Parcubacteria group bacterium RIFCSPHIGHO2_01_FULL_47_10b]|nr:MAG: hypothetical protein A2666_03810 [Parcubacteria group bacterium RIFCSPHIGHO2_01_FULL_47_10b]